MEWPKQLKRCQLAAAEIMPFTLNYQGQGFVLKTLTLELIESLKEEDIEAAISILRISVSLPGYLKMGWEKLG